MDQEEKKEEKKKKGFFGRLVEGLTKTRNNIVKGIDNVFLASQWLMGPGGLPTAAAMGKFAAWRIMNGNFIEIRKNM